MGGITSNLVGIYTFLMPEGRETLNNSDTTSFIMNWDAGMMIEVLLKHPDDFLKVRETLTRIGVASRTEKTLYQSCHILHKQGRYFIVHFKELFLLDGKSANFTDNDILRRNRIAKLISDWGLVELVTPSQVEQVCTINQVKILPYRQKGEWQLVPKYSIGSKK